MSQPIIYRRATFEDALTLSVLATQVFLDTYATSGVDIDLAREASSVYGLAAFEQGHRDPAVEITVGSIGEHLIGFLDLDSSTRCPVPSVRGLEVFRLYVQAPFQRCGVGRHLMPSTRPWATETSAPPCTRSRARHTRIACSPSARPQAVDAVLRLRLPHHHDHHHAKAPMKYWLTQNRGFLVFLLCFGFFRSAVADWNPIPSGSMRPTLLEGDVVLVNRLAYDFKLPLTDIAVMQLGSPQRGDVITFTSPADGVRLIKRLVALPGDIVEMRNEVLFINGSAAAYGAPHNATDSSEHGRSAGAMTTTTITTERIDGSERHVQFLPSIAAKRDFGPISLPADSYFFLGDNRDNSADSRYIGVVPRRLLIGRAHHILVSANIKGDWLPRWGRVGERIQ